MGRILRRGLFDSSTLAGYWPGCSEPFVYSAFLFFLGLWTADGVFFR
jgi:hypothetical protein